MNPLENQHLETHEQSVKRGVGLLDELLALKSAKDGIPRAPIGEFGHMDAFSRGVHEIAWMLQSSALAMHLFDEMAALGRELQCSGLVKGKPGESDPSIAVTYLRQQICESQKEVTC